MRYIIITKKTIIICGAVILAIALFFCIFKVNEEFVIANTKNKLLPIYSVQRNDKKIAISFDAAWGNEDTEQLISILKRFNAKATFFVVGEWVDKFPNSVKALADAGHDIENHSDTHPHMPKLSHTDMIKEINDCNNKIQNITKRRPQLFRPPYGDYDNNLIKAVSEQGMFCIQWDVDSLDWKNKTAFEIENKVVGKVNDGSVVLFHNAAKNTPEALPDILEKLTQKGYEFVTVSELIYLDNYYIDHTGRQHVNPITSLSSFN